VKVLLHGLQCALLEMEVVFRGRQAHGAHVYPSSGNADEYAGAASY
jgi:hypothetical protein